VFVRPAKEAFAAAPSISLDYAVMERSDQVRVVPVDLTWSDVGSWDAVHRNMSRDDDGNVLIGDVVAMDVSNSLIRSDGAITVAAIGLEGMVCVVTPDAVLLAPLDRAQDVKRLADELRTRANPRKP
jgi:mannose-1-phosphate guanylyltransferase